MLQRTEPLALYPPKERIGEVLCETAALSPDQFQHALDLHRREGVRIGQALVSLDAVSEEQLAAALARQAHLPYVDLPHIVPDEAVARRLSEGVARERRVLPLYDDGDATVLACAEVPIPPLLAEVEGHLGRPVRPVIVADAALEQALDALYRDEYLRRSTMELRTHSPRDSAHRVLSAGQTITLLLLLVAAVFALVAAPIAALTAIATLITLFYVGFCLYKFYLVYRALTHKLGLETTDEEVAALDDRDLPIYTILVPVYHEAAVFPILVKAIAGLDYPKAKLDVRVLLEEDDEETIRVARASRLPAHFRLVIVPPGGPQGKPKACNYGLIGARGAYTVIYDAEDIPEPDQLKKAILAFRKGGPRLACVQARLNFFNRDHNLLTRWFTNEYSMWFDLFLLGLAASGAPIPLGGTSNHFKTELLRGLGAWDPYNVTEDADLGIRMHKAGWRTAMIDSTTYEEANSRVYNWIRQRSRWIKGYVQTYLVHMRDPLQLWRVLGTRGFLSFQLVVGGTFFVLLVNPLFWLLTALWFAAHWAVIQQIFPAPVFYLGAIALFFGNFTFAYLNMAGCLKRGYHGIVRYGLLSPLYWVLMSVAAWKGFLQLFYAPSYWEKTTHGLSGREAAEDVLAERVVEQGGAA